MQIYEFPEHNIKVTEKLRFPWRFMGNIINDTRYFKIIFCTGEEEQTAFQLLCFEHNIPWNNDCRKVIELDQEGVIGFFLTKKSGNRIKMTYEHVCDKENFDPYGEYKNVSRCDFSDYWKIEKLN